MVPEAGLEPARPHQTLDFESNASTIPPFGRVFERQMTQEELYRSDSRISIEDRVFYHMNSKEE